MSDHVERAAPIQTLYGRDPLLRQLHEMSPGVIVVHGDSGVGKSALLRELANPRLPQTVLPYAGSLVAALIDQLSVQVADAPLLKGSERRLADAIRSAVAGAAGSSLQEVVKFIGRQLASIVRAKWGDTAAEALDGFLSSVASDAGDALQARIAEASQPEAPAAFAKVAREVAELLGGVHLVLDTRLGLSPSDFEVLAALPQLLPRTVRVTIALAVSNARELESIRTLQVAGATAVEVAPLSTEAVTEWLRSEGLDTSFGQVVTASSGGYPLFVEAAVASLAAGESIEIQIPLAGFRARTQIAWDGLSTQDKRTVQRLAFFAYPLAHDAAAAVAGVEAESWAITRRALIDVHLFSPAENGDYWFHDRKRAVLQELLSEDDRRTFAKGVVGSVWDRAHVLDMKHFVDFAAVVSAVPWADLPPRASAALQVAPEALACWAALLELGEPRKDDPGFVSTSMVLIQAGKLVGRTIAPRVIEELHSAELCRVFSDRSAAIAVIRVESQAEFALLLGRCLIQFKKLPFPSVASAVVKSVIIPRLYGFAAIQYGVGDEASSGLPRFDDDDWHDLEPPPWGITIRTRFGERLIYTHARFTSEEARDQAALDLQDVPDSLYDEALSLEFVLKTPAPPFPAMRFVRAWNLASRSPLLGSPPRPPRVPAVSLERAATLRCQTRKLIRDRSGPFERFATGLLAPSSIAYASGAGRAFIAEVFDRSERVVLCNLPDDVDTRSPYFEVEFVRSNDFDGGSRLRNWTAITGISAESAHPTAELICDLSRRALEFSHEFGSPLRFANLDGLNEHLAAAQDQLQSDARALLEADLVFEPIEAIEAESIELLLYLSPTGWFDRPQFSGVVIRHLSNTSECYARIVDHSEAADLMSTSHLSASYAFASDMLEDYLAVGQKGLDDRSLRRVLGIEGDYRVPC